jgi:hypothetical protein
LPQSYLKIPIPALFLRLCVWLVLFYRKKHFKVAFRKIKLTQNKFTIVDAEDFEKLNTYKWYATGSANNFYTVRVLGNVNGRKKHISMHRQIMTPALGLVVDHIDGVGLNNTKANLRIVTPAQNVYNSKKTANITSSKYKGVSYDNQRNIFRADIGYNGHRKFLGHFDNETDAAKVYDKTAIELYGEYANLNFSKNGERIDDLYNRILSSRIERLIDYLSNLLDDNQSAMFSRRRYSDAMSF